MLLFLPLDTFAHSGGTDAKGCHTNRKTGEYHCHSRNLKSRSIEKTDATSETGNEGVASKENPSAPQNKNRIFQWVDEKGEVHYSDDVKDIPISVKESVKSK